jgi:hypothetical protein
MSDNPGGDHHRYAGKPRIIPAARRLSVRKTMWFHISLKSGQRHQRNEDDQGRDPTAHHAKKSHGLALIKN